MSLHVQGLVNRHDDVEIAWLCDVDDAQTERMSRFVRQEFQPKSPKRTRRYEEVIREDPGGQQLIAYMRKHPSHEKTLPEDLDEAKQIAKTCKNNCKTKRQKKTM